MLMQKIKHVLVLITWEKETLHHCPFIVLQFHLKWLLFRTCTYHICVFVWSVYHSVLILRIFGDWQRKSNAINHRNPVSIGVQYETADHRKQSTASMTVICKDCQVQTGKLSAANDSNTMTILMLLSVESQQKKFIDFRFKLSSHVVTLISTVQYMWQTIFIIAVSKWLSYWLRRTSVKGAATQLFCQESDGGWTNDNSRPVDDLTSMLWVSFSAWLNRSVKCIFENHTLYCTAINSNTWKAAEEAWCTNWAPKRNNLR